MWLKNGKKIDTFDHKRILTVLVSVLIFSHLAMDLFIGFFCLFIFVCFVVVLVISFLLRRVSVLQWQLEATSGA